MTKLDRAKLQAQARERRRFRTMIAGGPNCAYGLPAVTLYVQAVRLATRIEGLSIGSRVPWTPMPPIPELVERAMWGDR